MNGLRLLAVVVVLLVIGQWVGHAHAQTFTTIDNPSASETSSDSGTWLTGISGSTILGIYWVNHLGSPTAFLYSGSSFTSLSVPFARSEGANGIDGANIVGTSLGEGFLYNGSSLTTIEPPLTTMGSHADGISGNDIVGSYRNSSGQYGFLYNGTSYITLADPFANSLNYQGTYAFGISGNTVVGTYMDTLSQPHGFLYNTNTASYTTFDVPSSLGTDTTITGIDGNDIVGWYSDSSYIVHGFFYDGQNFTTITDPLAGVNGTIVMGVSGNTVVGYYYDSSNAYHGFVATVPEPSTFALLCVGAMMLVVYGWKKRKW